MQESVTSVLQWPWAIWAVLGTAALVGVVTWIVSWRKYGKTKAYAKDALWVANSSYVADLPSFTKRLRIYRVTQFLGIGMLLVALLGTGFLLARPAEVRVVDPRMANRDIVLCLDVSGSMVSYDQELVEIFSELTKNFSGERIAMSIFNSTTRIVFPLTDDYQLVREELQTAYEALDPEILYSNNQNLVDKYLMFTAGANGWVDGSSLIGDGLASCALQFEGQTEVTADGEPRSKTIIFATDNAPAGEMVYTLQEAADVATDLDVSLVGIYGAGDSTDEEEQEFRKVFTDAGGMYFFSADPSMVDAIVVDILSKQAVDHEAAPIITTTDKVGPWFIWILLGLGAYLIVQRRLGE